MSHLLRTAVLSFLFILFSGLGPLTTSLHGAANSKKEAALPSEPTSDEDNIRSYYPFSIETNFNNIAAEYRLPSKIDIGIHTFISRSPIGENINNIPWNFLSQALRQEKTSGFTLGAGAALYPWKTSAFFLGLSLAYESSQVVFDAFQKESATLTSRVGYTRDNVYLAAPVGWNWFFSSGLTFRLGVTPAYRLYHSRLLVNDGGESVDISDRDDYIQRSEEGRSAVLGGQLQIGYFF